MFQRLKGNESGQSIVIIAFAMVAIIGMAALVLDGGYAYLERRRVQNAADAAALAGARGLMKPESETTIRLMIDEYAVRNGITSPSTNIKAYFVDAANQIVPNTQQEVGHNNNTVPPTASGILVQASEQHATFFAQVIGFPMMNVSAVAQAGLEAVANTTGIAPVAVQEGVWITDTKTYVLWDVEQDCTKGDLPHYIPCGSRGWLRLAACNGNTYNGADGLKELLEHGYPCDISIDDELPIEAKPGVTASVFKTCELWPEFLIVPIYRHIGPGGYHVAYFAEFKWNKNADDTCPAKIITGQFKRIAASSVGGAAQHWGAGTLKLRLPATLP
jgi:Flp pilus assembly protein TadG